MPTIEHNKIWAEDFDQRVQADEGYEYYGQQWGDPGWKTRLQYWGQKFIKHRRLKRLAVKLFGKHFFDPIPGDLSRVAPNYIKPYVKSDSVVLEIGPGGGRWTSFFLKAKSIILVELNTEFFAYLDERFPQAKSKFVYYQTRGDELDGIASDSVDYVFTFGTFVHLEPEVIERYLGEIVRVLRGGGVAVLQYADKTKPGARGDGFTNMTAERMEQMVATFPALRCLKHDVRLLNHSNIIVLQKAL